jgi:L-lactate dehydrogenase complex protein LldE
VRQVGLLVPCYTDAFEPEVGIVTLELLERLGCTVEYRFDQIGCGQPIVNSDCHEGAAATEALFVKNFVGYGYIVCPSESFAHQARSDLTAIEQAEAVQRFLLTSSTWHFLAFPR